MLRYLQITNKDAYATKREVFDAKCNEISKLLPAARAAILGTSQILSDAYQRYVADRIPNMFQGVDASEASFLILEAEHLIRSCTGVTPPLAGLQAARARIDQMAAQFPVEPVEPKAEDLEEVPSMSQVGIAGLLVTRYGRVAAMTISKAA